MRNFYYICCNEKMPHDTDPSSFPSKGMGIDFTYNNLIFLS